jgi:hypothetical protein
MACRYPIRNLTSVIQFFQKRGEDNAMRVGGHENPKNDKDKSTSVKAPASLLELRDQSGPTWPISGERYRKPST